MGKNLCNGGISVSHKRMKLLLISVLLLVVVLFALDLLMPQLKPYTYLLLLVVGIVQTTVVM